jgi:hypothetical protein
MLLALASIFFIVFLAFIAYAPEQGIQLLLFLTWSAMGLTVVWTLVRGLLF